MRRRGIPHTAWSRIQGSLRELRANGNGLILITVALGWTLGFGGRLTFPVLLPDISSTFEISLSTAGLLLSVLWVAFALMAFPGGMIGDRFGERAILAGSTVIATLALCVLLYSPTLLVVFLGTVLFGIGTGLFGTTRVTVLSDSFPDRAGTAIGISAASANIGTATLPPLAGAIAILTSWRLGFGYLVPLFILVALGLWYTIPRRTSGQQSAVDEVSRTTVRRVYVEITARPVFLAMLVMLLSSGVYQGFTGFYPTYLETTKGLTPSTASLLFGLFFGMGVIVQLGAGVSGDRFGKPRTMVSALAITILGLAVLPLVDATGFLAIVTVLLSAHLGVFPLALAYMAERLSTDVQGTGLGLIRTVSIMVAAGTPFIVGALADLGLFDEAFWLLAVMGVVGGGLCLLLPPVSLRSRKSHENA